MLTANEAETEEDFMAGIITFIEMIGGAAENVDDIMPAFESMLMN